MAIDISYAYNFIKTTCIGHLGIILKSTLWTAVLISAIILIIVIFLYPFEKNKSFSRAMKPIIYTFLSTIIIMFIHDSCIKDASKILVDDVSANNIIGGIKMHGEKNAEPSIYEMVYGEGEEQVKTRHHKNIGNNAYVESTNNTNLDEKSHMEDSNENKHQENDDKIISVDKESK